MVETRSLTQLEVARMKHMSVAFFNIPENEYEEHDLTKALRAASITHFNRDFIGLSVEDIYDLSIPAHGDQPERKLPMIMYRRLMTLTALFHFLSKKANLSVDVLSIGKGQYDKFRTEVYDPSKPIVPWNTPNYDDDPIAAWRKNVRPSKADYKVFKDPVQWNSARDRFVTTVESHGLTHLITHGHVPADPLLDRAQCTWLYKVMQDVLEEPYCKSVVKNFIATKDTREIWKRITAHHESSMTAQLNAQTISAYVTSIRLINGQWRGTQQNFILHFKEQLRTYNDVASDPYTNGQMVQFLNTAVSGVAGLTSVLMLRNTAAKVAGIDTEITLDEFVQALLEQASIHDSVNTAARKGRQQQRSINEHDLYYSDDERHDNDYLYEVELHDADSTVDQVLSCYNSQSGNYRGQRPRTNLKLGKPSWESLAASDQNTWDLLSDAAKQTILKSRPSADRHQNPNPNDRKRTTDPNANKRRTNTHEIEESEPPPTLEVQTHKTRPTTKDETLMSFLTGTPTNDRVTRTQSPEEVQRELHRTETSDSYRSRSNPFSPEAYSNERIVSTHEFYANPKGKKGNKTRTPTRPYVPKHPTEADYSEFLKGVKPLSTSENLIDLQSEPAVDQYGIPLGTQDPYACLPLVDPTATVDLLDITPQPTNDSIPVDPYKLSPFPIDSDAKLYAQLPTQPILNPTGVIDTPADPYKLSPFPLDLYSPEGAVDDVTMVSNLVGTFDALALQPDTNWKTPLEEHEQDEVFPPTDWLKASQVDPNDPWRAKPLITEEDIQANTSTPKKKMSNPFSHVDKPTPLKERIIMTDDRTRHVDTTVRRTSPHDPFDNLTINDVFEELDGFPKDLPILSPRKSVTWQGDLTQLAQDIPSSSSEGSHNDDLPALEEVPPDGALDVHEDEYSTFAIESPFAIPSVAKIPPTETWTTVRNRKPKTSPPQAITPVAMTPTQVSVKKNPKSKKKKHGKNYCQMFSPQYQQSSSSEDNSSPDTTNLPSGHSKPQDFHRAKSS